MMASKDQLAGKRILVVEDELMLAMALEAVLRDLGCEIVGPVSNIDAALAAAQQERLDGALLDMNLRGRCSAPVAEALAERSVPFIVVTGYAVSDDDAPVIQTAPRVAKPFRVAQLATALLAAFAGR